MRSALREVVVLGGLALQSEDCAIRAAVHHRGEHGGLARIENERHHQFIIWRAILPVWHAELERDANTDIYLECEDGRHHFELKNWTGIKGEKQLPSIQADVHKLQNRRAGYVLITSINPQGQTDENIRFLLSKVSGLDVESRVDFRFLSVGRSAEAVEVWIAGWLVTPAEEPLQTAP